MGKIDRETFFKKLIGRMQSEAQDYASRIGVGVDDLHCTLSFAIIGPIYVIAASIGDSPLFIKTKGGFSQLDGNKNYGSKKIVYSALSSHVNNMAVSIGFSDDLQAILIMSDGCLGYKKEELLVDMTSDFPEWFYDIIQGRLSTYEIIQILVIEGYDDCSFSYYSRM